MLRIYADILDWIEAITPLIRQIARHDPNLASQLERASTSVALNTVKACLAAGSDAWLRTASLRKRWAKASLRSKSLTVAATSNRSRPGCTSYRARFSAHS